MLAPNARWKVFQPNAKDTEESHHVGEDSLPHVYTRGTFTKVCTSEYVDDRRTGLWVVINFLVSGLVTWCP